MIIIGVDYHPSFQQIAFVATGSGEFQKSRLRVCMEASGQTRWFERLLAELNLELWIGDAAEIRAKRVRK